MNIPVCPSIQVIQTATHENANLEELKMYIIHGWPHKKEEIALGIRQYWPISNRLAMTDGILMKVERIIIPSQMLKIDELFAL